MIDIYLENDHLEYWLKYTGIQDYNITRDLLFWKEKVNSLQIGMIEILNFDNDTEQRLSVLCQTADLVLVFMPEFITDDWVKKYDQPNVTFFICGALNYKLKHSQVYLCPYFFWSTISLYKLHPELLGKLNSTAPTKNFDILLGRRKTHRNIIFDYVDHTTNIVKYFPDYQDQNLSSYNKNYFEWPAEIVDPVDYNINMTVDVVTVKNTIVSLSQVIPINIYNQSRYTLVAETQADNNFSFFTEKIVKPIIGQRLFVVCSGQYYLANLRQLGFKTFDCVIDESYDSISDMNERVYAACRQVRLLEKQDPIEVQNKIKDIVSHNYQLAMNYNWQSEMIETIAKVLKNII